MSTPIDIAEALVTELNDANFSMPVVARRHYQPKFDLSSERDVVIAVVPAATTIAPDTRDKRRDDVRISIGVQKQCEPGDRAHLDSLMSLVGEIIDHLAMEILASQPSALFVEIVNEPIYDIASLAEDSKFFSLLNVTYRKQVSRRT